MLAKLLAALTSGYAYDPQRENLRAVCLSVGLDYLSFNFEERKWHEKCKNNTGGGLGTFFFFFCFLTVLQVYLDRRSQNVFFLKAEISADSELFVVPTKLTFT